MRLTNIIYNLFAALLIGVIANVALLANPMLVAAGVFATGASGPKIAQYFDLKPLVDMRGMALMALQKEIWQSTIEEEIFADNKFMNFARRADDNVLGGAVVHIPQSGGSGTVHKNPTNFPLTIRQRIDTDIVYPLNVYALDPVVIPKMEQYELSYDKRVSVLGEDLDRMKDEIAKETIFSWINSVAVGAYSAAQIPAAFKVAVTGANGTANAEAPDATGNRKKAVRDDLQIMRKKFKDIKRWKEGKMYCMLTTQMMLEMFPANDTTTATYMAQVTEAERREGVLFKAHGWNIVEERTDIVALQADGTLRAPGEVGAATDNSASLFWYSESVEVAMGSIEFFEQRNDPTMLGDVYNIATRHGGRARRSDYKGIMLLHQTATT